MKCFFRRCGAAPPALIPNSGQSNHASTAILSDLLFVRTMSWRRLPVWAIREIKEAYNQ